MNYFNWKQYLVNYSDLKNSGINNQRSALRHYISFGLSEGKTDNKLISNFNPLEKKVVLFANVRDESNLKEWVTHGN